MIFAGAAQFAAVDLLDQGAGVPAIVAAIFMINARHIMYSAALSTRFRAAPLWFKVIGSYLLIDQAFALNGDHASAELRARHIEYQMWYYFGTAGPMAGVWLGTVAAGIVLGQLIPPEWEIDFAIPLMFLGLLVMSTFNVQGVVAALIGGTVAVLGRDWPSGSGLLTGAIAGVIVAGLLDLVLDSKLDGDERGEELGG
jgi:predicted branched-subunit amino acid permease